MLLLFRSEETRVSRRSNRRFRGTHAIYDLVDGDSTSFAGWISREPGRAASAEAGSSFAKDSTKRRKGEKPRGPGDGEKVTRPFVVRIFAAEPEHAIIRSRHRKYQWEEWVIDSSPGTVPMPLFHFLHLLRPPLLRHFLYLLLHPSPAVHLRGSAACTRCSSRVAG